MARECDIQEHCKYAILKNQQELSFKIKHVKTNKLYQNL